MVKILEKLVEQYAPENVRKQLAKVNDLRTLERQARHERKDAERALLVATIPRFPDTPARMAAA